MFPLSYFSPPGSIQWSDLGDSGMQNKAPKETYILVPKSVKMLGYMAKGYMKFAGEMKLASQPNLKVEMLMDLQVSSR